MKKKRNEIRLYSTDEEINNLLNPDNPLPASKSSLHFNYNEEFFIKLPETITVPHLPVHHDIDRLTPEPAYRNSLLKLLTPITRMVPDVFKELTYFFDPVDILRPGFFHLYRVNGQLFLYLLRVDLNFRTHFGDIIEKGGNDATHTFSTSSLFLENDIIPLSSIGEENRQVHSFFIEQHLSDTWIGESGKGYFVQGIWIDRELTKFFSKLFMPRNKRSYPYYPFTCKYQTICHSVLDFSPEGRKRHLKILYQARAFLNPYFDSIQKVLSHDDFSESLPLFTDLKEKISPRWAETWDPLKVNVYLNSQDMKEFQVEF